MANGAPEERSGREIRLLLLVIIVAVAGLLVLARFRFPAADIVTVTPTPSPLDRIAVRAPFDEMAGVTTAAAAHILPFASVLETAAPPEPAPKKGERPAADGTPTPPAAVQRLPALRLGGGRLLAYVPPGMRPVRIGGRPAQIAGEDPARGVVLVTSDLPVNQGPDAQPVADFANAVSAVSGARYVLVLEGAEAGPAVRPAYLARADAVSAAPWDSPLWQIGGHTDVTAGAFLFTVGGQLIGLAVPRDGGIAIVAAATLDRLARELPGPPSGGQ